MRNKDRVKTRKWDPSPPDLFQCSIFRDPDDAGNVNNHAEIAPVIGGGINLFISAGRGRCWVREGKLARRLCGSVSKVLFGKHRCAVECLRKGDIPEVRFRAGWAGVQY